MKLGSLRGGRDGCLVVIAKDGKTYTRADDIAPSLREALEDWGRCEALLRERSEALNSGAHEGSSVELADFAAPLPRTFNWIDASAYRNHIELMCKVMGMDAEKLLADPIIYQGAGDDMLGPAEDVVLGDEAWGLDLEAELGAIFGEVPMGSSVDSAQSQIRLLVLLDDLSLRNLLGKEISAGFGPVRAKPATVFAPFAITPDELEGAWQDGRLDLEMRAFVNDRQIGNLRTNDNLLFTFAETAARVAQTRNLIAGTIIGSGTVSNPYELASSKVEDGGPGYGCIAEVRAMEQLTGGEPITPYLSIGSRVRIEAADAHGELPFGSIDHRIVGRQ
jgi:fumarylacetoacetate (FAA) hydrolase